MIKRFQFGTAYETDAVIHKPAAEHGELPYFTINRDKLTFTLEMKERDKIYGLGENIRGINKRGWIYESRNTDDPNHTENRRELYAAHNFFLYDGEEKFGVFMDIPGMITFDIGYSDYNIFEIRVGDWNLDVYLITGVSLRSIVKEFRMLIGRSYIPPKWAFGYGQSRWGYRNEDDIREVVQKYRSLDIPLDSVYMDIDYMERYKDFTVNQEAFPNLDRFGREMRAQNIHLVPIIDAAVKIEEGYDVYEEGIKKEYFCKKEDGSPFAAAVWPGKSLFPDVLNKEVREWFGNKYRFLLDQGIDGFWNDMNEPAIFYTEKRLNDAFRQIDSYKGQNLDIDSFFEFTDLVNGLKNHPDDYKEFYHNMDGKHVRHDLVHNLYGFNMTRAAGEAFERLIPDKRILLISRSSYIGMHRYGGIWTGDNQSWWSHLLLNIKMMPSLNMCGFLYSGADIGGFGSDTTYDLMMRWLAFGIFTPLMRNHSADGTRTQEVYRFHETEGFRHVISVRYKLLPYIYSEFMKAVLSDDMLFRPLAFDYPEDRQAGRVEDQLLMGESIMLAPVYEQNAEGRYVYLPEDMKQITFRQDGSVCEEICSAGLHYIEISLTDIVFFIRKNHIVPVSHGGMCVSEVDFEHPALLSYAEKDTTYLYYNDDGEDKDYDNPAHFTLLKATKQDL